jgi:hypothetical protein
MTMTKQHFEAIARILSDHIPVQGDAVDITYADTVTDLADYFKAENPRFDVDRFKEACGLGEDTVIDGAPRDDKDGVEQTWDAIVAAGFDVGVQDGANEEFYGLTKERAVAEVMSCDEGFFIVMPKGETNQALREGYIYFVFGNAPEEVINDYTTNLDYIIDPLSKRWGW